MESICTSSAPRPAGPYSQAIRANGFIFVSGQLPLNPATGAVQGSDITVQARQAMENIRAILEAAGSGLHKVVKTTLFLRDLEDFAKCNEIYAEYFGTSRPARFTAQAARLPRDVLLEMDAVAVE